MRSHWDRVRRTVRATVAPLPRTRIPGSFVAGVGGTESSDGVGGADNGLRVNAASPVDLLTGDAP